MADYLPPVVTKLVGDIDDFLLKIEEAKAAVRSLGDENGTIPIKFEIDEASLARAEAAVKTMTDALPKPEINIQFNVDTLNLVTAVTAERAFVDATSSVATATNNANRSMGLWIGPIRLTTAALHWLVLGSTEFLAVAVPAFVALAAAAAVALQGTQDVVNRVSSIYTVTEALGPAFHTTAGQVLGLSDNLQKAQNAMQPQIYEIFGGVLDALKGHMGQLTDMGKQVISVFDRFVASIDVQMRGALGNTLSGLIANGVNDLTRFGQVLGNLGHAILNFAAAMPGLAEVLLGVIDGISKLIFWLSTLPKWLITSVMAGEEFLRWGSLLVNLFGRITAGIGTLVGAAGFDAVGGAISKAGNTARKEAGSFSGLLTTIVSFAAENPLAAFAIAAGLALTAVTIKILTAKDSTQQWVSSLEGAVSANFGLQQIGVTYQNLQQVTSAFTGAQKQVNNLLDTKHVIEYGNAQKGMAAATAGNVEAAGQEQAAMSANNLALAFAKNKSAELSAAQKTLSNDFNTEISNVEFISKKYGVDYVQAAQLAGAAGVSLTGKIQGNSNAAQIARQQIDNLRTGYMAMGQAAGSLGDDINAVSIATALQQSQISKLNQSWDTVVHTIQAPSSSFLSMAQSLAQFNKDATISGAQMTGLGGAATTTAHNVSTASIQLQTDFNTSVTAANAMIDSLRTAAAVTGNTGPLVQGIKDAVAALIPMAGSSQAAQAQIYALAQEANGPASGGMQAVAKWAGKVIDPMGQLQTLTGKAAMSMANLGADSANLAATIQTSLNQTLVAQAQILTGVSQKTATYLYDLQHLGSQSPVTQAALADLNNAQGTANNLAATGASSLTALTGKQVNYSSALDAGKSPRSAFNVDLATVLSRSPGATGDVNNLAIAVRNHGTTSSAYQTARAKLIADLEKSGLNAKTATGLVDNMTTAIKNIPPSKAVSFTVSGTGQWSISQQMGFAAGSTANNRGGILPTPTGNPVGGATGMRIPGYGGGDTFPAMLEPGETVVPKHLTPHVAGLMKAHGVPGFAQGGIVPHYAGGPAGAGQFVQTDWAGTIYAAANATANAIKGSIQQAMNAMVGKGAAGSGASIALGQKLAASMGWTGVQWQDLYALWMRESGWNAYAVNPSSGAAGIAQSLGHGAVQLGNAGAQISWGLQYILQRYGNPANAWQHELSAGWYDNGGYLPPGLSLAMNGTGAPEPIPGPNGTTGQNITVENKVYLDGRQIFAAVKSHSRTYNRRNSPGVSGKMVPGQ